MDAILYNKIDTEADRIYNALLGTYPQETLENQSIASFSDGADGIPVKELTAFIEPVQDLHGYDNPWPAGGGANKADIDSTSTLSGMSLSNGVIGNTETDGKTYVDFYCATYKNGTKVQDLVSIAYNPSVGVWTNTYTITDADIDSIRIWHSGSVRNLYCYVPVSITETGTYRLSINFIGVNPSIVGGFSFKEVFLALGSSVTSYSPYSNICPISGHTECNVTRSGINIWDEEWESGAYDRNSGDKITVSGYIRSKNYIPVSPSTTYYRGHSYVSDGLVLYYESDYTYISSKSISSVGTFTTPENAAYITFFYQGTTYGNNICFNYPSTDHDYHPGTVETYDIDFPIAAGTVYGGTLTVHQDGTGTLVVDRAIITDLDQEWWYNPNATSYPHIFAMDLAERFLPNGYLISTTYKGTNKTWNTLSDLEACVQYGLLTSGKDALVIRDNSYTDRFEFKDSLEGCHFVAKLATPITYTLSAEQVGVITTLLGENNVWHSCNGKLDITYRADLAKYITKDSIQNYIKFSGMIAGVETGLTASKPYNSGEYFIVGQKLYKATASIASGATFTVGTNCTETTVGAELVTLNS